MNKLQANKEQRQKILREIDETLIEFSKEKIDEGDNTQKIEVSS
jgi:hypothetical protein